MLATLYSRGAPMLNSRLFFAGDPVQIGPEFNDLSRSARVRCGGLKGLRVFVVEDESMVSMLIEDMLADLGCEVMGTAAHLDEAVTQLTSLSVDAVVLDVNLGGTQTDTVAELLAGRNIPFVAATGYGTASLPQAFKSAPAVQKPFQQRELEAALSAALTNHPGRN
jgi:CheY-like chemotaxis protein